MNAALIHVSTALSASTGFSVSTVFVLLASLASTVTFVSSYRYKLVGYKTSYQRVIKQALNDNCDVMRQQELAPFVLRATWSKCNLTPCPITFLFQPSVWHRSSRTAASSATLQRFREVSAVTSSVILDTAQRACPESRAQLAVYLCRLLLVKVSKKTSHRH